MKGLKNPKKREFPKPTVSKKFIRKGFWVLFGICLFLSVVAIIRVANATNANTTVKQEQPEVVQQVQNEATGEGAKTFSSNFAKEYFVWKTDDPKERAERLKKYLAEGMNEQAGVVFEEGNTTNSNYMSSKIWKVKETGKDTSDVTLAVTYELAKVTTTTPKPTKKQKKKGIEPKPVSKTEKSGPFTKYFVVPVKTDGQSFVVYKTPTFAAAPTKPNLDAAPAISDVEKITDKEVVESARSFANTYLKVYTTGTQEELAYYMKEKSNIRTMNGVVTFKEIQDFAISNAKEKGKYKIELTALMEENSSKTKMVYPFQLTVFKKSDQWILEKIEQ